MAESGGELSQLCRDAASYRRVLVSVLAASLLVFAVGVSVQAAMLPLKSDHVPILNRLVANLCTVAFVLAAAWSSPLWRLRWPAKLTVFTGICLAAATLRGGLQIALHVHPMDQTGMLFADAAAAAIATAFSIGVAVALAEYQRALVHRTRAGARHAQLASNALEALRTEELRVRRDVAQGLHGTVQQQLVLVDAELLTARESLIAGASQTEVVQRLDWVRDTLDRLRERDIRDMSRLLYPSGLDLGLAQACRIFIRQIPSSIEVSVRIDDSVICADDPASEEITVERRLLALRVLEEAVNNAIRHGHAGHLDISLHVDCGVLHIAIDDDGTGPGRPTRNTDHPESGLRLLRENLRHYDGDLTFATGVLGGARLTARLPLTPITQSGERSTSLTTTR